MPQGTNLCTLWCLWAPAVLLEYLTDCSIRVSQSYIIFFGWGGHVPLPPTPSRSATGLGVYWLAKRVWLWSINILTHAPGVGRVEIDF